MKFWDLFRLPKIIEEHDTLQSQVAVLQARLNELGYYDEMEGKRRLEVLEKKIADKTTILASLDKRIASAEAAERKATRLKELYKSAEYAFNKFVTTGDPLAILKIVGEMDELVPSSMVHLNCMDVKSLAKAYRENEKQIDKLIALYEAHFTSKTNKAIFKLAVLALRSELQTILTELKYEKLAVGTKNVRVLIAKYLKLVIDGNQALASTFTRFMGELEYLFINAIKIEYNYYVKKEQAKQEQAAIREQMKQEAAERKALEAEKKKVEAEEKKYQTKIDELQNRLADASSDEADKLKARILELEAQLANVAVEKERIVDLQNGKAGNIYVISNLGSFGDKMFKVGMTRRANPQDRVNELGDASVPFKFDVHCFIFSKDAVSLEAALHARLSEKRVNKVNLRKEFFYSTIEELEALVHEIDPTAAFTKTMMATEFRQSLSSEGNYTSEYSDEDSEDEE